MRALFAVLSIAATVAWLVGYLAPIWRPNYTPAPELNIVMMAVIGIFATLYSKATQAKNDRRPIESDKDNEDEVQPKKSRKVRDKDRPGTSRNTRDEDGGSDDGDE